MSKPLVPVRYKLTFMMFMLSLLLYIDRICISTAKGQITGDLNLTDKQFGWIVSAFALGYALFQTPGGWMSDKFGPRKALTVIISIWSVFTALTGMVSAFISMIVCRFLFGAGEAGAFPGMARAIYSWIPMKERGIVNGINFSASRLGAAAALVFMPFLIGKFGWRGSFSMLGAVGALFAVVWFLWFRDEPSQHKGVSDEEREFIDANRQHSSVPAGKQKKMSFANVASSKNMWLAMIQYFCSNFTFFFCLTWLYPYIKKTYGLSFEAAGFYSAIPLIGGAIGQLFGGWLVDTIYKKGNWAMSRRIPAIIGFSLASIGLLASLKMDSATGAVAFLTLAVFGADMTLSPSWSFCVDVGKKYSGVVSGTMNMAGNIGSFVTGLAFPYLTAWTANNFTGIEPTTPFFITAAILNMVAVVVWTQMRPDKPIANA